MTVENNAAPAPAAPIVPAAPTPAVADSAADSAAIKKALCGNVTGDRGWLRKIRPWRGHNDHH